MEPTLPPRDAPYGPSRLGGFISTEDFYTSGATEASYNIEIAKTKATYSDHDRDNKQLVNWARERQLTREFTTPPERAKLLYEPLRDVKEIRVLELSPGDFNDELVGTLRHVNIGYDRPLDRPKWVSGRLPKDQEPDYLHDGTPAVLSQIRSMSG